MSEEKNKHMFAEVENKVSDFESVRSELVSSENIKLR